jgi:hypothetical protein
MRLLALDADTRGLALPLEQLHAYIGASRRHLREQVLRQRRRRLVAVASIFSMLLPVLLFAVIVQMPTLTRVTRMVEASSAALAAQQPDPDDAPAVTRTALVPLMAAAAQMDGARSGRGVALSAGADAIFRHLPFLPGVRSLGDLLRTVGEQSEAVINPRLRATLAQATGSHAANPWTTLVAGSDAGVVQAARRAPEGSACHTLATRLESFGIKRAALLELPGHCLLVGRDAQGPTGERMAAVYRRTEDPGRSPSPMLWAPLGAITNLPADGGAPADWQFASAGPRAGWLLVRVPRAGGAAQAWGLPLSTCALWRAARAIVSGGEDCASP